MSQQQQTQQPAAADAILPTAQTVPTHVADDGSSVSVGYTESDPVGPNVDANVNKEGGDPASGLIAGKFKSVDDLEKAYKELEAKMGVGAAKEEGEDDDSAPPTDTVDEVPESEKVASLENTDEAASLLKENGLDINTFTVEYERTGQLSPESYAKLNAAGITTDMVNAYIDGQRVMVESQVLDVKNSVGGEAEYAKLIGWADTNLSDSEKLAYQRILDTNDLPTIKLAAAGLQARYRDAMGKDPSTVINGAAPSANDGRERFGSRAEMVKAMQDERYDKDPAYRARVEQRVINSNF